MSGSEDTCCSLSLWCCSAVGGPSAGCRTSCVCLQHHDIVVTSNGVTIWGSKFPPTFSKHCQHQHSAIPNIIKQYMIPKIPAVVISKVLLPQSNSMAAFVHSHSSLFSDVCQGLQTYNKPNVTQYAVYSVQSLAADLFSLLPKTSNCQHTTTHLIFYCLTASCDDITALNKKLWMSGFSRIKCMILNQTCCQLWHNLLRVLIRINEGEKSGF